MSAIVKVSHLKKVFPPEKKGGLPFTAVNNVSFEMEEGEILGLLGPNGAGKSTTISMLLGTLKPTEGNITYFGKDFAKHSSEILEHVTFASTYIKLPWRLTVWENLKVYAYLYGLDNNTFNKRVEKFLHFFGVWEQKDKSMNMLSAGQVTRVMLTKAFIPHPKVVLLDEPTASLDPDIAHQIRGFVKQQQQEFNTTILYTSHNMDEVAAVCDRVLVLKQGNLVANDTPDNLAKTLTTAKVHLLFKQDLKKVASFFKAKKISTLQNNQEFSFEVDEHQVAPLLMALSQESLEYTQISIDKPTLEDYFLKISQQT